MRMVRACIVVAMVCELAAAQDSPGTAISRDAQSQALSRLVSGIRVVDPNSFASRRPFINIDVEGMMPAVAIGQVRNYGGPLQTYLNLAGADVAHDLHLPFGATAVVPINRWRMELFGGIGGAFTPFHTSYAMTDSWMAQTSMGVRVALDPGRHVWVGGTARYITDFADKTRQWGIGTADLTIRFGK